MAEISVNGLDLIHSFLRIWYIWKAQGDRHSGPQIPGVSRAVQAQKISCKYFFSSYFCILVQ